VLEDTVQATIGFANEGRLIHAVATEIYEAVAESDKAAGYPGGYFYLVKYRTIN
jgi:hypothetical protein